MDGGVRRQGQNIPVGAGQGGLCGVTGRLAGFQGLAGGADLGQAAAVQLAAHGDGQLHQRRQVPRHHVGRQAEPQPGLEVLSQGDDAGVLRHKEPHQGLAGPFALDAAGGGPHPHVLHQAGFDGLQLDAVAPQLHLAVPAAQVVMSAVRSSEPQISRAVDAAEGGVLDELQGRGLGVIAVAAGQARSADAELAGLAGWHLGQGLAQHPGVQAWNGLADGDGTLREDVRAQSGDGALRGAVAIHQPPALAPAVGQVLGQGLAAHVEKF